MSIQLYPIEPTNWRSLVNFSWNLALTCLPINRILAFRQAKKNMSKYNPELSAALNEKPLLNLLVVFIVQHLYPIAYFSNVFYYFCINFRSSRLIRLLDSFNQIEAFNSEGHSKRIFFWLAVLHHSFFLLTNGQPLFDKIGVLPWYTLLLKYWVHFILYISSYNTFTLILYYKIATYLSLTQLNQKYRKHRNIVQLHAELRLLAFLNVQLNQILSLPFLIICIPLLCEILLLLSILWIKPLEVVDLYLLYFFFLLLSIAILERRIDSQLFRIEQLLKQQRTVTLYRRMVTWTNPNQERASFAYFDLISHYQTSFQLQIFNIFTVNLPFLGCLLLFVLQFTVLLIQTSV